MRYKTVQATKGGVAIFSFDSPYCIKDTARSREIIGN